MESGDFHGRQIEAARQTRFLPLACFIVFYVHPERAFRVHTPAGERFLFFFKRYLFLENVFFLL